MSRSRASSQSAAAQSPSKSVTKPEIDTATTDDSSSLYRRLGLMGLILLMGWLAHRSGMDGVFVFDDFPNIVSRERVHEVTPVTRFLSTRRPLTEFTFALNWEDRETTAAFHRWNIAIHLGCALLLFGIANRTFRRSGFTGLRSDGLAGIIALIWVVHPLTSQAVVYIVQRAESLMTMFYLATLYCVIRSDGSAREKLWWLAAIAASLLGMGSKAVMVTAPVVILLYDRTFLAGSFREVLWRRKWLYLGLVGTWAALALVVKGVFFYSGKTATVGFGVSGISATQYFTTQLGVIPHYFRLAAWPSPLCLDYKDWPVANGISDVLGPALVTVALAATTVFALVKHPRLGFLGAVVFIVLAPTSSFIPLRDVIFEHRFYLPLMAIVALAVVGVDRGLTRLRKNGTLSREIVVGIGLGIVTVVVIAGRLGTSARNEDYHSRIGLWRDVVDKRPDNSRAHNNFGKCYFLKGKELTKKARTATDRKEIDRLFRKSEEALKRAIELDPNYAQGYMNLGKLYEQQTRADEAMGVLEKTILLMPERPEPLAHYGRQLMTKGETEEAIKYFERSLTKPQGGKYILTHGWLGVSYAQVNRYAESEKMFKRVLRRLPRNYLTRKNLAKLYLIWGKPDLALFELERVKSETTAAGVGVALSEEIDTMTAQARRMLRNP